MGQLSKTLSSNNLFDCLSLVEPFPLLCDARPLIPYPTACPLIWFQLEVTGPLHLEVLGLPCFVHFFLL